MLPRVSLMNPDVALHVARHGKPSVTTMAAPTGILPYADQPYKVAKSATYPQFLIRGWAVAFEIHVTYGHIKPIYWLTIERNLIVSSQGRVI